MRGRCLVTYFDVTGGHKEVFPEGDVYILEFFFKICIFVLSGGINY